MEEVDDSGRVQLAPIRANLISAIAFLANSASEQKHVRYDENGNLASFFDFDLAINILFDDIPYLDSDPRRQIGISLANEAEADAVHAVVQALDLVLEVDYPDDIDEHFVTTPRWVDVVSAAHNALQVIKVTG
jgi:hypothetical protein